MKQQTSLFDKAEIRADSCTLIKYSNYDYESDKFVKVWNIHYRDGKLQKWKWKRIKMDHIQKKPDNWHMLQ